MPQALITVNGVPGSNTDLPIGVLVLLNNQNAGGEVSYKWSIVDQPAGPADVLSSVTIQNPTITLRKEGTYKILLIVNEALPSEVRNEVVIAVLQLKTRTRVPAVTETTQASALYGWAGNGAVTGANPTLQRLDSFIADPDFAVAQISGSPGALSVVRFSGSATIKAGLPGAEVVPVIAPMLATNALVLVDPIGVIVSAVDGGSLANGKLANVRKSGLIAGVALAASTGDAIYVSDTGTLSLTAGTNSRKIGYVVAGGATSDIWIDGRIPFVAPSTGLTWPLLAPDGTAGAPSYSWATSPTSGISLRAPDELAVSVAGAFQWAFVGSELRGLDGSTNTIAAETAGSNLSLIGNIETGVSGSVIVSNAAAFSSSSGAQRQLRVFSQINQSATAGFTAFEIALLQSALGSGAQHFADFSISGTSHFGVTSGTTPGRVRANIGAVGSPSYSFQGATTTGLWAPTADTVGVAGGGLEVARFQAPGGATPQALFAFGTSAAPAIGWQSRAGGLYSISALSTGLTMDQGATSGIAFTRISGHYYAVEHLGSAGGIGLRCTVSGSATFVNSRITNGPAAGFDISQYSASPFTGSSLAQKHVAITSVVQQTSTSAFNQLELNQTQTSLGSGAQRFVSGTVGGTERFAVTSDATMPGQVLATNGSAARPTFSFTSDQTSGVYLSSSTVIGISFAATARLTLGGSSTSWGLAVVAANDALTLVGNTTTTTIPAVRVSNGSTFTGSSGSQAGMDISSTINQTSTAGFSSLFVNQSQTALGSGAQRFFSARVSGTERFAIASDATMPGQVLADDGSNARPTYSFLAYPTLGMSSFASGNGVTFGNDTDRYLETYLDETTVYGDFIPDLDNARSLGLVTRRWEDVFAVQTTIGDLVMRDPHPKGKKLEEIAHWKLIEGLNGIAAYNIRTGRKYMIPMAEVTMDDADRKIVADERERWVS